MKEFVVQIEKKHLDALGSVRAEKDLQIAEDEEFLWLRGSTEQINIVSKIPESVRYHMNDEQLLFLPDAQTPVGRLKELQWQPLSAFIKVELPVSVLPGRVDGLIDIRLVPSQVHREGQALCTSLTLWKEYAETAPAVRLERLRFAVSENDEVIIIGSPLPPLPGQEYWIHKNCLIPSGLAFEIPSMPDAIKKINSGGDHFLFFDGKGRWQLVDKSFFAEATRSAVRLTQAQTND